ncbi:MAG: hypothetical protein ACM3ZF_00630 [Mycobacterium leprae]
MSTPSLDGRRFRDVSPARTGDVGADTVFEYHEEADGTVWARYAGGAVRLGFLVGRRSGDTLEFRYAHLTPAASTATGHCTSIIAPLADGRLRLVETWSWDSRSGSGTSVLEEAPS